MKKLHHFFSTCFLLLILSSIGLGQTSGWPTSYANLNVRAMTIDAGGNIYITGPADGGKKTGLDFVTVKYAPNGHLEWAASYNGPNSGEDWPYAIAVDVTGNVFVTGRSFTSKSGGSSYNFDYATVKYNPQGGLVWARRFGSTGNRNDVAQDVKVDVAGNAYVTGYADATLVLGGGNAIVTIKYNPSGDIAWTAKYDVLPNVYTDGNPNSEQAYSLAVDTDGNVYIAGTVLVKYNSSGLIVWEDRSTIDRREVLVDPTNNVFTTGFSGKTSKYNSSGNLLWQISSVASSWDMALDQTGNVYVTGEIDDVNGNSSDFWTVKYDGNNNGSELWSRRYNGSANSTDFGRSITVDNSGNVYVTGHSTAASGRNTISVFRVIKYNNIGTEQWITTDEGDGFVIETDPGGNVYASGTVPGTRLTAAATKTFKFAPSGPAPRSVTTAPAIEDLQNSFSLKNYPNPFSQSTIIEYQLPVEGKVKLTVFDLSGHEMETLLNEYKPVGIHKINFKANKLPAGTYFYRIQAGKYTETKKLIILK